jgi:tetratricopeptide (TPR) repeat protein
VFVSYSHKDEPWKDLLLPQLEVLVQLNRIDLWADRKIDGGDSWYPEIKGAMERAKAAVCLISAHYLSSPFVLKEEVPYFLAQREERGLLLLPVLVSSCPWELVEWISAIQMVPRDGRTLDSLPDHEKNAVLSALAGQIAGRLGTKRDDPGAPPQPDINPCPPEGREKKVEAPARGKHPPPGRHRDLMLERSALDAKAREDPAEATEVDPGGRAFSVPAGPLAPDAVAPSLVAPSPGVPSMPEAVDITRLPVTGAELFGRAEELRWLDQQWESRQVRVASLVAWGGVGKSTLVNKWLERMAADGYRGARKVFGWSFFSQGTSERVTSADLFIDQALRFFGDSAPTEGSSWSKGERLAALVRGARNLLLLDGLEPLQSQADEWRVQDPGLGQVLRRLARPERGGEAGASGTAGLCVITSRERVTDLDGFPETTAACNLEEISPEAGRALLRVRGVHGTDAELEDLARAFGNQALAVNLVASFLHGVPGHPAAAAADISDIDLPDERRRHASRVLEAFARRYAKGPEAELLQLLGLFDRPAPERAFAALRAAPAIRGLTYQLTGLSESEMEGLLWKLRAEKLIAEEDRHQLGVVDAHPLVREHFGERLKKKSPRAWRQAHRRLFEFYSKDSEPMPNSAKGLAPVFAAVYHGSKACRYKEALDLYYDRIQHWGEFFAFGELGLPSESLQALTGFFEIPWTQPIGRIPTKYRLSLMSMVGGFLGSMGRLQTAAQARESALAFATEQNNAEGSAIEAYGLALLCLAVGDSERALTEAKRSVKWGESSNDVTRCNAAIALATCFHQKGKLDDAEHEFQHGEELLRTHRQDILFLNGWRAFYYSDLLLDKCAWKEVKRRTEWTLKGQTALANVGLDNLSLGRAYLLAGIEHKEDICAEAVHHLEMAVEMLRRAGQQSDLPRGLVARAELRRLAKDFRGAEDDLEESLDICVRCELRLLEADTHLGYARLHLAAGNSAAVRASLDRARTLIERTGYHRRDRDLAELETAFAS